MEMKTKFWSLALIATLVSCTGSNPSGGGGGSTSSSSSGSSSSSTIKTGWAACKTVVYNRGSAKDEFLNELLAWAKAAPDEIFAETPTNNEIYPRLVKYLGPWTSLKNRKAALMELMRVSAAYESSFDWNAGRDTTNPSSLACPNTEAGIFQTSANVLVNYGGDLKTLFGNSCSEFSGLDCQKFQVCTKQVHPFAMETHARLLRHANGFAHYGPIVGGHVNAWLSRKCAAEFESKL